LEEVPDDSLTCQDYELAEGQNDVNIDRKVLNGRAIDRIV
jgi:hypothetical protein